MRTLRPKSWRIAVIVAPLLAVSCGVNIVPSGLRAAEQMVVLHNGSVLRGDVTRLARYVVVRSTGSEIRLDEDDVELVAPDLAAAYRAKSQSIAPYDATTRCRLVRWCLRHGLKQEAEHELERIEQEDPLHPQLKVLRRQVESYQAAWKQTTFPAPSPPHPDREHTATVAGQLSKTSVAQFARHVQPLLINRCGQAACHGRAASNDYRLASAPHSKLPRGLTDQNLGATLRQLEAPSPQQSQLWLTTNSLHGGLKQRPVDEAQLRRLQAWIERAHLELTGGSTGSEDSVGMNASGRADRAEASVSDARDPFDPSVFNERVERNVDSLGPD